MKSRSSLLIVLLALAVIAAVWSTLWIVAPGQQTLDTRVQRVASQLKCLICQGESVADSPSTLAQQMRASIRRQLQAGRSEQDIIHYFQQSYGDQIIWSPPWQGFSLLAWLVPIAFLLCGLGLIILLLREWHSNAESGGNEIVETRTGGHRGRTNDEPSTGVGTSERQIPPARPDPTITKDLERYRALLEAELADDDVLFRKPIEQSSL